MKTLLVLFGMMVSLMATGQSTANPSRISIGTEVDALPYLTGGYYGSVWISRRHLRYRAITTQVTTPAFVLQDGFQNNELKVYALITDYFFKVTPEKWWVGAGVEYWDGKIQTDALTATSSYENLMFTIGGGYILKFYKHFYINPWIAVHLKMAGDSHVMVDDKTFKPSFFSPEGSVKIGWYFDAGK